MKVASPDKQEPGKRKRAYSKPRLTEFGDIAKLTQNGFGSGVDGGGAAGMMMMCL
jgi:hypothetical protein